MTTERLLALASLSEKVFSFYSEKGYHYDGVGQRRVDPRLKSIEAIILAQDIWEGKKHSEEWIKTFGDVIELT